MNLAEAIERTEPTHKRHKVDIVLESLGDKKQHDQLIEMLQDQDSWPHLRMSVILTLVSDVEVSEKAVARWRAVNSRGPSRGA